MNGTFRCLCFRRCLSSLTICLAWQLWLTGVTVFREYSLRMCCHEFSHKLLNTVTPGYHCVSHDLQSSFATNLKGETSVTHRQIKTQVLQHLCNELDSNSKWLSGDRFSKLPNSFRARKEFFLANYPNISLNCGEFYHSALLKIKFSFGVKN